MDKLFINSTSRNIISCVIGRNFCFGKSMKNIEKNVVESLERLALVDFPTETAVARLEKCVEYADKLMEVDTTSVEPLISTVCGRNENLRGDKVVEGPTREELMKIAPITEEFYYVAPLGTFSRDQDKSPS